jgi:putative cardiolipin synthase
VVFQNFAVSQSPDLSIEKSNMSPGQRVVRLAHLCRLFLSGTLILSVVACVVLPPEPDRPVSHALADERTTTLGRTAEASLHSPELSGFRLLPVAEGAYLTRLSLAALAERTLDVQYYILQADDTGKLLMRALRDAAARGVRVRLLVDDLYTAGNDELLLALAAYPNVEVRLFNPFPAGRASVLQRFVASAADFSRVNHRMHNKMLVADNAFGLAGGRNIADEYFMRASLQNYVDLDVLAAGPVVRQMSIIFDRYWNSEFAWPVAAIVKTSATAETLRAQFDQQTRDLKAPTKSSGLPAFLNRYIDVADELAAPRISMIEAPARIFADSPEKVRGANEVSIDGTVRQYLEKAMDSATKEISGSSPYYVTGEEGVKRVAMLKARGVTIHLHTNSLASTDEPMVHIGYVRYRAALLRAGMDLYELSPDLLQRSTRMGFSGASRGRLHAKVCMIDRRLVFLGSLNMDNRSERKNTELGLWIDSPALAEEILAMFDTTSSYRLRLAANGEDVEWIWHDKGREVVLTDEPEAGWLLRLQVWLLSPFGIDEQL